MQCREYVVVEVKAGRDEMRWTREAMIDEGVGARVRSAAFPAACGIWGRVVSSFLV
jgi:hypothetical protein